MSRLAGMLAEARRGLRTRRRRAVLSGVGIALAAAMLSAAIVVADGLGLGFDRAASAAGLPDLIVRFNNQPQARVGARIRALPDVAGYATRFELTAVGIAAGGRRRRDAVAEVVGSGRRRGYAVVAGRDVRSTGSEVAVESAFAQAWGLRVGSTLEVGGLGPERVVGLVEAPDNVGFPLARPRFYVSRAAIDARFGPERNPQVNLAEVWLRNPRYLNEVLVQARASSFGLHDIRFVTRSGLRVLLDQAAGIVIDLLVALSLIALVTAGVMLAASARAEIQRRMASIGVQRAVGATGGHIALTLALESLLVAAPAAALGTAVGTFAIYGAAGRLLTLLNEPAPGSALLAPLLAGLAGQYGAAGPGRRVAGLAGGAPPRRGAAAGRRPHPPPA